MSTVPTANGAGRRVCRRARSTKETDKEQRLAVRHGFLRSCHHRLHHPCQPINGAFSQLVPEFDGRPRLVSLRTQSTAPTPHARKDLASESTPPTPKVQRIRRAACHATSSSPPFPMPTDRSTSVTSSSTCRPTSGFATEAHRQHPQVHLRRRRPWHPHCCLHASARPQQLIDEMHALHSADFREFFVDSPTSSTARIRREPDLRQQDLRAAQGRRLHRPQGRGPGL